MCVSHSVHRGESYLCMVSLNVWLPGPMFLPGGFSVTGPMFLPGRGVLSTGSLFGGSLPGSRPWTDPRMVKSGPYASYWNAFYRPQTKFVKVMFLHLSVSHSVHRGLSASVHAGIHPPGRHPPPAQCMRATSGRYASYWNAYLLMTAAKNSFYAIVTLFVGVLNTECE